MDREDNPSALKAADVLQHEPGIVPIVLKEIELFQLSAAGHVPTFWIYSLVIVPDPDFSVLDTFVMVRLRFRHGRGRGPYAHLIRFFLKVTLMGSAVAVVLTGLERDSYMPLDARYIVKQN